jgi:hypothetical protein
MHYGIVKSNLNILALKKLLYFIKILIFSFLVMSSVCLAGESKAVADGSFVQSWLCGSWSDARWQQEFTAMKNAGMHYLVVGPLLECTTGQTPVTIYPSALPNTELSSSTNGMDMVDICLRNAETAGIKVFLGISMNDLWWTDHGDTTWFYNQMENDNKVCDEVWNLYKSKYPNAFYGWYWAYEIDNANFVSNAQQDVLIKAMNIQLDHLTTANERLPFMWCPYMVSASGTPDAYKTMWQNMFSKLHIANGDIFAPQDCVGAGWLNINEVPAWFSALRQAVDTKPGLAFWSDLETFIQSDWTSATIDRVVKQLKMEQPYVDNFITFAYCHYDSPNNINPGFQATYIDYLNNGVVETTPPSVPADFTAAVNSSGKIELNWNASTDNIGICGYYVYRNGVQIDKIQVPVLNGSAGRPLATNLTDASVGPNSSYTYVVKAYDFANNISSTPPVTVNTGDIVYLSNKISTGCSYTVSITADSNFPDTGNKKLTDGKFAGIADKADPGWEAVYDTGKATRDIIIYVGRSKQVQQFVASYLYDSTSYVFLPKQVKVSVSTDNVSFTDIGDLSFPAVPSGSKPATYKGAITLSGAIWARYIKFSVTPGGPWTFDDEYEVRNNNATGVNEEKGIPKEYALLQNYPNPFNPTTLINYKLAKEGHVILKVYDMLGKEVKMLVNENKSAGSYSVNLNASSLTSGIYFYQIRSGNFVETRKMILMK